MTTNMTTNAPLRIAVIGTGNIGSSLGNAFSRAGHAVIYGARSPEKGLAKGESAAVTDFGAAVGAADVVVLAIPGNAVSRFAEEHRDGQAGHPQGRRLHRVPQAALEVARPAVQAERLEAQGRLDETEPLLDPHIGALTQIVDAYRPEGAPVVVDDVVRDIDSIVKQVRYTGWNETQEGDRTVRLELRKVLKKYALPLTGALFDNAYAYVRENC